MAPQHLIMWPSQLVSWNHLHLNEMNTNEQLRLHFWATSLQLRNKMNVRYMHNVQQMLAQMWINKILLKGLFNPPTEKGSTLPGGTTERPLN
uniref:Uncharacterized protein n=1 Tax=Rhizophora mucronata TaxID=61149 RepID=A0A2P2Q3N7_RHIMU